MLWTMISGLTYNSTSWQLAYTFYISNFNRTSKKTVKKQIPVSNSNCCSRPYTYWHSNTENQWRWVYNSEIKNYTKCAGNLWCQRNVYKCRCELAWICSWCSYLEKFRDKESFVKNIKHRLLVDDGFKIEPLLITVVSPSQLILFFIFSFLYTCFFLTLVFILFTLFMGVLTSISFPNISRYFSSNLIMG